MQIAFGSSQFLLSLLTRTVPRFANMDTQAPQEVLGYFFLLLLLLKKQNKTEHLF